MSDDETLTIEDARKLRDTALRAHETNEARGTEYRIGAGLAYEALRVTLDAHDRATLDLAAAIARAERAEADLAAVTRERDDLSWRLDSTTIEATERLLRERAERAEEQLAALREAARVALLYGADAGLVTVQGVPIVEGTGPFATLRAIVADTAQAAEAYRARVEAPLRAEIATARAYVDRRDAERAEALEAAAQRWRDEHADEAVARWLRARAADERGTR